jgi:hypothetical protein
MSKGRLKSLHNSIRPQSILILSFLAGAMSSLPIYSQNTGSASELDFLIRKYGKCIKNHNGCRLQQTSPASYPSKLTDVGSLGDAHVSLRHMRQVAAEGPNFAYLIVCAPFCMADNE